MIPPGGPTLDVAVIGGGPAGAAVAFRLARLGYAVAVIHAPRPAAFGAVEVVAPTILHLADALPLAAALDGAVPVLGTRLLWSGAPEWVPASAHVRLVCRTAFDAALLARCAVPVLAARARAPRRVGGIWQIALAGRDLPESVSARFLVDASGRAGGVFGKAAASGPETAVVVLQWRGNGLAPGTLVTEASEDAWCWGAALPRGEMQIAVFCDMRRCAGLGRAAIADLARRLLGGSTLFSSALARARLIAWRIGDATARVAAEPAGDDWLRVGDAACAADPVSSQGVCAALRLGVQAAAVVHTMLGAGNAAAALEFYRSRVAEDSARSRRMAAAIYAERRGTGESRFWLERAAGAPAGVPAVAGLRLVLRKPLALATVPALVGERIACVPAILDPSSQHPIAWVGGHSVADLLRGLPESGRVSDFTGFWSSMMPADEALLVLRRFLQTGIVQVAAMEDVAGEVGS